MTEATRKTLEERLNQAVNIWKNAVKAGKDTEQQKEQVWICFFDWGKDILFLQKRERPLTVEPDWVHLGQTANGIPVNSYFAAHPEMMLGTMVREPGLYGNENETACIPLEGAVLSE